MSLTQYASQIVAPESFSLLDTAQVELSACPRMPVIVAFVCIDFDTNKPLFDMTAIHLLAFDDHIGRVKFLRGHSGSN